ncbi:PiggyBac transposable element-derived protein 4 [Cucumispora dikerogammari]|nr:PiggyBac transposable element-derived protein 4 [Cucumispora dikerogammari]
MHLAIDESTIPHKGGCGALVYNKTKPNRWGMKLYMLCSSESGCVYRFKLHTGEKTFISETVNYLTDCYRHHNIHLFIDNFYSSSLLFKGLLGKGFFATGTCRKNRIGLPDEIKQLNERKIPKNKMILFLKSHMNAVILNHRKLVTLIFTKEKIYKRRFVKQKKKSSVKGRELKLFNIPKKMVFINNYNNNMNGVDICDQNIQYYYINRKSKRWTMKLLLFLIDIFLLNFFVLYKKHIIKNVLHLDFNLAVAN